ncbi:MAG: S8 family serine peptidase [Acidobacteriota bacterium]
MTALSKVIRKFLLLSTLLLVLLNVSSAEGIGGKWKAKLTGRDGTRVVFFNFNHEGDSLTGTVDAPWGTSEIKNGKVNGSGFSFEIVEKGQTITFNGKVEDQTLRITLSGIPQKMEFLLTRDSEDSTVSSTAADNYAPGSTSMTNEKIKFPKIDRHPAPADYQRSKLSALPSYDAGSERGFQVDLRSYDLTGLDLSKSLNDLMYADFDSRTKWPQGEKIAQGFDYKSILEINKNPGLGIRGLHKEGITGKGISIAIIDQPLIIEHQEYNGRIKFYEEVNMSPDIESQMHGPAVASIAVGKTTGVAPKADLYYMATFGGTFNRETNEFTRDYSFLAKAVRRILEINRQLPEQEKIRVISMSIGWGPNENGAGELQAAVSEAKSQGIFVVSSNLEQTYGFRFHGLGRSPISDPDDFSSYEPGLFWRKMYFRSQGNFPGRLLVPMDSRTTASPNGVDEYTFYREGGWSWSIPYIASVYALAAQVSPSVTPEKFWKAAMETGRTIRFSQDGKEYSLEKIIDPSALIKALRSN